MRESFELAWTTALMYSRSNPKNRAPSFVGCDEVTFAHPVPIGSVLQFTASCAYASPNTVQVFVDADVLDPETNQRLTTNVFEYAFHVKDHHCPPILPVTYLEGLNYIKGRRNYQAARREGRISQLRQKQNAATEEAPWTEANEVMLQDLLAVGSCVDDDEDFHADLNPTLVMTPKTTILHPISYLLMPGER